MPSIGWEKTADVIKSDASHSTILSLVGAKWVKKWAHVNAFFRNCNTASALSTSLTECPFSSEAVMGYTAVLHFSMDRR